jgi:spore photoproduct lyase
MLQELEGKLAQHPEIIRIGTGELMDSLLFDRSMEYNRVLIPWFASQRQAFLELKTKLDSIDHLLDLETKSRTVIAWSLNPQKIITGEEGSGVSLTRRLKAAARCTRAGYHVAFHFDPVIYYEGWKHDYFKVVDKIADYVDPQKIIMISMGTLRFNPQVKEAALRNHPHTKIFYGEFIRSPDGKMRYFKPIREELYGVLLAHIRRRLGNVFAYMCMETTDMWRLIMNEPQMTTQRLKQRLDSHYRVFTSKKQPE